MKNVIIVLLFVAFCKKMHSQVGYLSADSTKYSSELTQYCLDKENRTFDDSQKYNIGLFCLWAKKTYTKDVTGHFSVYVQPSVDMSYRQLNFYYKLVKKEMLACGLRKKRVKIGAFFSNSPLANFRGTCEKDVTILVFPRGDW